MIKGMIQREAQRHQLPVSGDQYDAVPGDIRQLRQLRHEDQDGQLVDEAGHHRFRHEAHQVGELPQARDDLQMPSRTVAAKRYSSPWSRTSVTIRAAIAAVPRFVFACARWSAASH